jgi:hypothetical protein
MKRFIAYFDYLGFKDFIIRNPPTEQLRIMNNNLRDIENALALGKFIRQPDGGVIADLTQSTLKCINFSDTVVIYSNDDSLQSLKEILDVALFYCSRCNLFFFPVRGCVYYGEFISMNFNQPNKRKGAYHVNSVFGEGLVNSHLKAENQAWAGGVIDNTICEYLAINGLNVDHYLSPFAKKFKVPYKENPIEEDEWVLHLLEMKGTKLNSEAFERRKIDIVDNFAKHNKRTDSEKVQKMISNTLEFLESYC